MTTWQERVDRSTGSEILVEHVIRYRFALPLRAAGATWIDLGCGTGLAAELALAGDDHPAVLVDQDAAALSDAGARFPRAQAIAADLADPADLVRIDALLAEGNSSPPPLITCFETIEHLGTFAPLLDLLLRHAQAGRATVVLSAPNDAATGSENPFHLTTWGVQAMDELRSSLPPGHVLMEQRPLLGSAIGDAAAGPPIAIDGSDPGQPSHLIVALGPGIEALAPIAAVSAVAADMRLAWEHQREADLAYYRNEVLELQERLAAAQASGDERRAPDA